MPEINQPDATPRRRRKTTTTGRTAKTADPKTDAKPKANDAPRVTPQEADIDLRRLISVLVPQATVVITDVLGNERTVPGAVSARTQIVLMRMIDEVKELPVAESINLDTAAMGTGGIVGVLVTLAQDPQVVEALAQMFEVAHPSAYEKARDDCEDAGLEITDAADVFPIEELVSALVPLFVRLAKRTGTAVAMLGEAV
jgi:hypothetical protein